MVERSASTAMLGVGRLEITASALDKTLGKG